MHAHLRSVRLAPKKANLMAKMVRGKSVPDAVELLAQTSKKSARIFEQLLKSAMANAQHNLNQDPQTMIVKTVVVNQGTAYHRGIPMARGRVRPIRKFLSHIEIQLGMREDGTVGKAAKAQKSEKNEKKDGKKEKSATKPQAKAAKTTTKKSSPSSSSSESSPSSDSSPTS